MTSRMEPAFVETQPQFEAYQQVGNVDDDTTQTQPPPAGVQMEPIPRAPSHPDNVVIVSQPVQNIAIQENHVPHGRGTTHLGTVFVVLTLLAFIAMGIVGLVPAIIKIQEEPVGGQYTLPRDWSTRISYWTLWVDSYTAGGPGREADRSDWDGIRGLDGLKDEFRVASALIITSMVLALLLLVMQCLRFCHLIKSSICWRGIVIFLWAAMTVFVAAAHGLTAYAVDNNIDDYVTQLRQETTAASLSTQWAPAIVVYWIVTYALLIVLLLYLIRTVVARGSCPCAYVPDPEEPTTPSAHRHTH